MYDSIRGKRNWVRGIWELCRINFSVNEKLFQNKKVIIFFKRLFLKRRRRIKDTQEQMFFHWVLLDLVVAWVCYSRKTNRAEFTLRTKLAPKVTEMEDDKAWIFDDASELLNKLSSLGAALQLDFLFVWSSNCVLFEFCFSSCGLWLKSF